MTSTSSFPNSTSSSAEFDAVFKGLAHGLNPRNKSYALAHSEVNSKKIYFPNATYQQDEASGKLYVSIPEAFIDEVKKEGLQGIGSLKWELGFTTRDTSLSDASSGYVYVEVQEPLPRHRESEKSEIEKSGAFEGFVTFKVVNLPRFEGLGNYNAYNIHRLYAADFLEKSEPVVYYQPKHHDNKFKNLMSGMCIPESSIVVRVDR